MDMEMMYCSIAFLASIFFLYSILSVSKKKKNLPPSPPSIPIIGHLHLLKPPFHRTFQTLSQRLGPIFYLQLGVQPAVVVSSPSAAEECFTQNDIVFANRPKFITGQHFGYNHSLLIWAPYGSHWRNLRRVTTLTTLSQKQIQLGEPARRVETRSIVRHLFRSSEGGTRSVNLNEAFDNLIKNLTMRVVNGKPWQTTAMDSTPEPVSPCDFLPILRWVGYNGVEKRILKAKKKRDEFLQGVVNESRETRAIRRAGGVHIYDGENKTMIEHLLDLQEADPDYYTDNIVKGLATVMLVGGSDNISRTMEWAMALLLSNPKAMEKAKAEIETHVEKGRLVEDGDIPKLNYISCVINETLRLYPPGPLLFPHMSSEACSIGGYHIPKSTLLFVNVWAIQRDPGIWEDPTQFKPERFEEGRLEGFNFNYFPFGMGRRACPGTNFALRGVTLIIATLIQCFDWELVEPVDLSERDSTIIMPKDKPLHAICRPLPSMEPVLSQL